MNEVQGSGEVERLPNGSAKGFFSSASRVGANRSSNPSIVVDALESRGVGGGTGYSDSRVSDCLDMNIHGIERLTISANIRLCRLNTHIHSLLIAMKGI